MLWHSPLEFRSRQHASLTTVDVVLTSWELLDLAVEAGSSAVDKISGTTNVQMIPTLVHLLLNLHLHQLLPQRDALLITKDVVVMEMV